MEADAFHCPRSNGSEALAAARQAQITNAGRAPCRTSRQTCAKVGLLIMAEPPHHHHHHHRGCVLKEGGDVGSPDLGEIICSDGTEEARPRHAGGRRGDERRRLAKTNTRRHDERTPGPSQDAETKRASSSKNIQPAAGPPTLLQHRPSSCEKHPRLA